LDDTVRFTSVEFRNFKAFRQFSIRLTDMNVIVGPNNCGKSTIVGAFRALAAGLRTAGAKSTDIFAAGRNARNGYGLPTAALPISVENVHTDYAEEDSSVLFRLSNGNQLNLFFPKDGGVILFPEVEEGWVRTPKQFRAEFPVSVAVVPVLGPVEHNEEFVQRETVVRELATHRASRHFRNYWHYFQDGFEDFANLVRTTWPGMEISPPEPPDYMSKTISMFCLERRIPRELYWSGFGFQVWCQMLTHVSRSRESSILVIDEPEIYLHPDVQRQLLDILRKTGPDILLATHSTEIIAEADPSEIVLVDKAARSGKRLSDLEEVQGALDLIGSVQNISLTQLARNRRVVFVEDDNDFTIVRRFARLMDLPELAAGAGLTPLKSEGFSSWERIRSVGWGIERTLGSPLKVAVVYDRDYFCEEEIEEIKRKLGEHIPFVHIHERKEMENYLLQPSVVERAADRAIRDRCKRTGEKLPDRIDAEALLEEASADLKSKTSSQYAAKRTQFLRSSGRDAATVIQETSERIDGLWDILEERMKIVSGKEVLKRLRDIVRQRYKIGLTDARLVDAHKRDDIAADLQELVVGLDAFRTGG
jgi:energy-coupling factor transporter ATP-binding protein EcfA2